MPGEGTLSLAGSGFKAVVCAYDAIKPQQACERTVAPPHVV
jgi:hypothetical protein